MKKIKFKYIILFLIPILFFIQYNLRIDNDFWFTIKEGEYVINNGFPNVVPFTIYDNLNFIYLWKKKIKFFYFKTPEVKIMNNNYGYPQ